jgi:hypothetical protein
MIYAKGSIVDMGKMYQMVIEDCPYCHGRHYHGAGDKNITEIEMRNAEGTRAPHCFDNIDLPDYYIIWDGRIIKHNQLRKVDKKIMKKIAKINQQFAAKYLSA